MKYHIGQKVWIWRGDKEKPYRAEIKDCLGKSSSGDYVYEFKAYHETYTCDSGCAEYDIYESEQAAQKAYQNWLNN